MSSLCLHPYTGAHKHTSPCGWERDPVDNYEIDCDKIFEGDDQAIDRWRFWPDPCDASDEDLFNLSLDCRRLHEAYPFTFDFEFPQNDDYANFPLAYVLVVEKNARQILKLLQAIYRPQNLYCITYDEHSEEFFKATMNNLRKCYPDNILMPEKHHEINWGGFSILEANIKYGEPYRYIGYFEENFVDVEKQKMNKPLPPGDLYIYKGSLASTLTREFTNFVFENTVAQQYYQYSKDMLIPEEQYWVTLIHNLHIRPPGGFPGMCKHYFWYRWKKKKPWISRHQMWSYLGDPCEGFWTHKSCVYGLGDLWSLKSRPELMAHKFYLTYQPATLYCLSKWMFEKTYTINNKESLDLDYYRKLPSVVYQNMPDKSKFNCLGDNEDWILDKNGTTFYEDEEDDT
uniref:Uncharacterized protein n=1 Tax=Romanomermis culicivorax TaxID=13658 RepID=A0A915K9D1_ROMCU